MQHPLDLSWTLTIQMTLTGLGSKYGRRENIIFSGKQGCK